MKIHPSDVTGADCDWCHGPVRVMAGAVTCLDCGRTNGLVTLSAKLKDHHDAIAAEIPSTTHRVQRRTRRSKALQAIDRLREPTLFDASSQRSESYGQTRRRVSAPVEAPRVPAATLRQRRVKCRDCDQSIVVQSGKLICPHCHTIVGDLALLSALRRAFPGSIIEDPEDDR